MCLYIPTKRALLLNNHVQSYLQKTTNVKDGSEEKSKEENQSLVLLRISYLELATLVFISSSDLDTIVATSLEISPEYSMNTNRVMSKPTITIISFQIPESSTFSFDFMSTKRLVSSGKVTKKIEINNFLRKELFQESVY